MRDAKQRHLPEPQTDSYRSYSYDLIGQRVEKCVDGECHNYQWGLDSGWLELVELPTEEDLAFSWSAGGNLLGISQTGQSVLEFQYDERGRASSIMFGAAGEQTPSAMTLPAGVFSSPPTPTGMALQTRREGILMTVGSFSKWRMTALCSGRSFSHRGK
jgi:YD repeat-containing protein